MDPRVESGRARTGRESQRNDYEYYQDVPRPVGAMAGSYPDGYALTRHSHPRAQFLYAVSGTMRVTTDNGTCVIPPFRAVWLPPNLPHQFEALSAIEIRTLYIRPDACASYFSRNINILYVSNLLRELVVRATELPVEYDEKGKDGRIIELLLEEIDWSPTKTIQSLTLRDPRLLTVEQVLAANPSDTRTLEEFAVMVGASPRTLARLFLKEAGTSFHYWRDQMRILAALPRLVSGVHITALATECGYKTPSAFTAMFKRVMGVTPKQYLAG